LADTPNPDGSGGQPGAAPPNFYEQAAKAPAGPQKQDFTQQNTEFQNAVTKLLSIFDKMEKMTPNGKDISKKIKAAAEVIKSARDDAFEGTETEDATGTAPSVPGTTGAATAPPSGTPGTPPAGM
jgi:hypothetical protein